VAISHIQTTHQVITLRCWDEDRCHGNAGRLLVLDSLVDVEHNLRWVVGRAAECRPSASMNWTPCSWVSVTCSELTWLIYEYSAVNKQTASSTPVSTCHRSPHHSHLLRSHHHSLDLKLISFTNPFLHSHSYSFRTAFSDLNLYWIKGALALVCFSFSFLIYFFLATCARLSWIFRVHVKLFYRIISLAV